MAVLKRTDGKGPQATTTTDTGTGEKQLTPFQIKDKAQQQSVRETVSNAGKILQNLPTGIARTVASPFEFLKRSAQTVGEFAASKIKLPIQVSEETKKKAQAIKTGMESDITVPFQTDTLVKGGSFKSVREAGGSALEAVVNAASVFVGGQGGAALAIGKAGLKEQMIKTLAEKGIKELTMNEALALAKSEAAKATAQSLRTGAVKDVLAEDIAKRSVNKLTGKIAVRTAAKDAVIGGGYGAAVGLQDKEATPIDILKSTATGAGIGVLAPYAVGGAGKVIGKGLSKTSKEIGEGLEKTATKLETFAETKPKTKDYLFQQVDNSPSIVQRAASGIAKTIRATQQAGPTLTAKFLDRIDPVKRWQRKMATIGIDVKETDIEELVRGAGNRAAGKAENILRNVYKPLRQKYGEDFVHVKEALIHMDMLDRLKKGDTITEGHTTDDINQSLATLKNDIGEERFNNVLVGVKDIQDQIFDPILRDSVGSFVTPEGYTRIKTEHPNYYKHDVVDYETGKPQGTSASVNVSKTPLQASKGGSKRKIVEDVDTTIAKYVFKQLSAQEKNRAVTASIKGARGVYDNAIAAGKTDDEAAEFAMKTGMAVPIRTAEGVSEKIKKIMQLKETVAERRAQSKNVSTSKQEAREVTSQIKKEMASPIQSKEMTILKGKVDEQTKKASGLMVEGEKIDIKIDAEKQKILDNAKRKSNLLEEKSSKAEADLAEAKRKYNTTKAGDLIARSQQLADVKTKTRALEKAKQDVSISKKEEKEITKKLKAEMQAPAETKQIKDLREKSQQHSDDAVSLLEDAEAKAASMDRKKQKAIGELTSRAVAADTKATKAEQELVAATLRYNTTKAEDLVARSQQLADVKTKTRAFEAAVAEQKEIVQSIRQEIKDIGSLSIKGVDVPKGWDKISYFKDGVREDWLVPSDVAGAMKNMDADESGKLMSLLNNTWWGKLATAPANLQRKISTTWSPVFATISNPARDIQTASVTANLTPLDWAKGLFTTITGKKVDGVDLASIGREWGGFQGGIFREESDMAKVVAKTFSEDKSFTHKLSQVNPLKKVEDIGQFMEQSTRMAVFRKKYLEALASGEPITERTMLQIARDTRNATVDFGKAGSVTRVVNKFVPFINARIQGFSNIINAAKNNPVEFTRKMLYTSAYPTLGLYAHNQNYQSYNLIPDSEKRKYWIIMAGESPGINNDGKKIMIPQYIKIPKGEAQQAVSSVLERALSHSNQKYPDSTKEFLGKMFIDTSPVVGSSLLPPLAREAIELTSNYSFFREKNIEPLWTKSAGVWKKTAEINPERRYSDSTSEIAKGIGEAFGWSPYKVDYAIKNGIFTDLIKLTDMKLKETKPSKIEKGTFEKASNLPFIRSVIGTSSYGEDIRKTEYEKEKVMNKNEKELERRQKILDRINKRRAEAKKN